ncbi:MAG: DUF6447 family protein [Limnobacter sp.]|nr:DUF6447 family protein [Limnobacter sp.]
MAKITIDGKEYEYDTLADEAKQQLNNLRVADQKIQALQQELAMIQTARAAYASTLLKHLPEKS